MFDILTTVVLFLSGGYEAYRIFKAVNSLSALQEAVKTVDADTSAYIQIQSVMTDNIIEIIVCSALLILTLICIIRFIRWAIIGNIIYLTHNTTKDFLKTTNGRNNNYKSGSSSAGGMKITNSSDNPPKADQK